MTVVNTPNLFDCRNYMPMRRAAMILFVYLFGGMIAVIFAGSSIDLRSRPMISEEYDIRLRSSSSGEQQDVIVFNLEHLEDEQYQEQEDQEIHRGGIYDHEPQEYYQEILPPSRPSMNDTTQPHYVIHPRRRKE